MQHRCRTYLLLIMPTKKLILAICTRYNQINAWKHTAGFRSGGDRCCGKRRLTKGVASGTGESSRQRHVFHRSSNNNKMKHHVV